MPSAVADPGDNTNRELTGWGGGQFYVTTREIDCMLPERLRQSVFPFLLIAYPATFLFFQGGQYCEPLCFEPTTIAAFELVVLLLVLLLVAVVVSSILRVGTRGGSRNSVRWLLSPTSLSSLALLGVFALFVVFLALDAISLYEALWKPIVLPLSFLVFLPVWALYMASFLLAMLFPVIGIESTPVVTLVFRGVVIAVGFPLSALVQTRAVSAIVDGPRS